MRSPFPACRLKPGRGSTRFTSGLTTVDHKRLGILYILYALSVSGGRRSRGAHHSHSVDVPAQHFVSPQVFNRMFTMHGTTMVFFVGMPILFGFANYLVPLMIGARDMAFPRLNAFSFWLSALGGLLLYFSLLGANGLYGAGNAPDVGWWAYAPLTRTGVLARPQLRLLDAGAAGLRLWQHWNRHQHYRDNSVPALPGHEAQPHAFAGVAQPGHGGNGSDRCYAVDRPHRSCCSSIDIWAAISSTRRPEGQPCCGCTSFGYLDIRKCTS